MLVVPLRGSRSLIGALLNLAGSMSRFDHPRIAFVSDVRRSGNRHVELIGNTEIDCRSALAIDDGVSSAKIMRIDLGRAIGIDADHLRRSRSGECGRAIQGDLEL